MNLHLLPKLQLPLYLLYFLQIGGGDVLPTHFGAGDTGLCSSLFPWSADLKGQTSEVWSIE